MPYGPAPWNREQYEQFRAGYKRLGAKGRERLGVEHVQSGGYRVNDGKARQPKMRTLTMSDGTQIQVPQNDYEDFIGFNKIDDKGPASEEIVNYIERAFAFGVPVVHSKGAGHIAWIEYSARYNAMKVRFETERYTATVVFFRIPKTVFTELQSLAERGGTQVGNDGKERHVLGIRLWDIVRIRGTVHGSRYPFAYEEQNEATQQHIDAAVEKLTEQEDVELFRQAEQDDTEMVQKVKDREAKLRAAEKWQPSVAEVEAQVRLLNRRTPRDYNTQRRYAKQILKEKHLNEVKKELDGQT